MRIILSVILITLANWQLCHAQQSDTISQQFEFNVSTDYIQDSIYIDSVYYARLKSHSNTLFDSIQNDTIIKSIFHPYFSITNEFKRTIEQRTNIPGVKEILSRRKHASTWKFWVICFILFYIAFVRIANPNNFRVFVLSVFNLKLSQKIWEEQRSTFSFVLLQLFAIYLFIAAVFINSWMEQSGKLLFDNYVIQYLLIVMLLLLMYTVKFLIHTTLGSILQIRKLGNGFVSNTVSVNNFIALVIFPFIIIAAYNSVNVYQLILNQAIVALFFVSVFYRIVRITLLSSSFFTFPKIYLFIYLCALEIIPWLIIVKFINTYPI